MAGDPSGFLQTDEGGVRALGRGRIMKPVFHIGRTFPARIFGLGWFVFGRHSSQRRTGNARTSNWRAVHRIAGLRTAVLLLMTNPPELSMVGTRKGPMMTNMITANATASTPFPLPLFVGIAFALAISVVIMVRAVRRHGRTEQG